MEFLDFILGKGGDSQFVQKLNMAVEKAKNMEEWRMEYMTLLMRDRQGREEGFNLAASILSHLVQYPSLKVEDIAEALSCDVEKVVKLRNLMQRGDSHS